jgi:hypothetical protein
VSFADNVDDPVMMMNSMEKVPWANLSQAARISPLGFLDKRWEHGE